MKYAGVEINKVLINDIPAKKVSIISENDNTLRNIDDVVEIINAGDISSRVKKKTIEIFLRLAETISAIYDKEAAINVFGKYASCNSIIQIVCIVEALAVLGVEKIYANKIQIGKAAGNTAEGIYPVPNPITLMLLKGFIIQNAPVERAAITPEAAAALCSYNVNNAALVPSYKLLAAGYGADNHRNSDNDIFNVQIGDTINKKANHHNMIIEFNVDDMNPQAIPYVIERILEAGAADAFVTQIIMKKGRPGFRFSIACCHSSEKKILNIIFSETTTIGVRKLKSSGVKLEHRKTVADTSFGQIQVKEVTYKNGEKRIIPEFEECRRIAVQENIPLKKLQEQIFNELNYKNATEVNS